MDGEPFNEHKAKQLLRSIIAAGGVSFSDHAVTEMRKDNLQAVDGVNVLRAGRITEPAELVHGTWRYRVRTLRMVFVVAFRSELECKVITAWRLRR